MSEIKLKGCPLLPQSDTYPSFTMPGESHMRTFLIPCIREKCVAYNNKTAFHWCEHFRASVVQAGEADNEEESRK